MDQDTSPATMWQRAYGELQVQLPRETFDTWLRDASLLAYEDGTFIISVPNTYAREWLEQRLKHVIMQTLERAAGRTVEVRFVVWAGPKSDDSDLHEAGPLLSHLRPEQEETPNFEQLPPNETGVNTRQTFETYAVGAANRLAHAASLAIVDAPGAQFNPLYIHADVGLGKSHLLHAIGNALLERGCHTLYVTGETFTNDLMASLRSKRMPEFRDKYRELDVLLIDDIQFIAGKTSTQEEFFHTFDTLFNAGGQIVIGASMVPESIHELDERLCSRFEGGLVVELASPDFLTRVDVLELKVRSRGFEDRIPLDTLELIAERVPGNMRDLEGALNQIIASSLLDPEALTPEGAASSIAHIPSRREALTLPDIVMAVADYYGVTAEQITGRGRARDVSIARQIAMYLAREEGNCTLEQIGEALGGRNHSTVLYSCEKVADLLATNDSAVQRQIRAILQTLRPLVNDLNPIPKAQKK